jgi:hypothetical protein
MDHDVGYVKEKGSFLLLSFNIFISQIIYKGQNDVWDLARCLLGRPTCRQRASKGSDGLQKLTP